MNSARTQGKPSAVSREQGQYLSFRLGADEYAVEILRVQEILGMRPILPVPQTPPHVRGVMNLRGAVVPVVDMRAALGLMVEEAGQFSVILVLAVHGRTLGFIVDGVSDVLVFGEETIDRTQDFGSRVASTYVAGIARNDERLVILLDVERIVDAAGQALAPEVVVPAPVVVPVVAAPADPVVAPVSVEGPSSTSRELDALCMPASWEETADPTEPPITREEPSADFTESLTREALIVN